MTVNAGLTWSMRGTRIDARSLTAELIDLLLNRGIGTRDDQASARDQREEPGLVNERAARQFDALQDRVLGWRSTAHSECPAISDTNKLVR